MAGKIDIRDLSKEELIKELAAIGAEKFRSGQILDWVYKKAISDFDAMVNLPAGLRQSLKERFCISRLCLKKELVSSDGTRKFLFKLQDSNLIESVLIPSKNTTTVCVSSQVGCKFACKFCASGKGGFIRDLRPSEITGQVSIAGTVPLTNVVFMGMGEPLDNYENVLKAIRILNAPYAFNIGQRKITISTCGIVPAIKRLSEEGLQIELSISLHSADDKVRSQIMGVNKRYPIKELIGACREYIKETSRQLTFEYVLLKGINDSEEAAVKLAGLLKGLLCKVNLIPFNAVEGAGCIPPEPAVVKRFKQILDKKGIRALIRVTRGPDIAAACGQLRLAYSNFLLGLSIL